MPLRAISILFEKTRPVNGWNALWSLDGGRDALRSVDNPGDTQIRSQRAPRRYDWFGRFGGRMLPSRIEWVISMGVHTAAHIGDL